MPKIFRSILSRGSKERTTFWTFYMHFFWQRKALSTLDPKGRAVFKLLKQNNAELAQLAVLFFWRPCNRKHSDFRVAYSIWNSNGKFQISSNSLIFFSDGSSRGPGDVEVVTTKSMSASQDISSDVRSRRWVSAKEKERSQNKSAYYYAPLLDYIATE